MRLLAVTSTALAFVGSTVNAQNSTLSSWTDSVSGVTFKLAIWDTSAAPFPILMSFVAPINITWAAFAAGACMLRSPLIVAWPNGTNVVVTSRWAR